MDKSTHLLEQDAREQRRTCWQDRECQPAMGGGSSASGGECEAAGERLTCEAVALWVSVSDVACVLLIACHFTRELVSLDADG
jgi:hypothetical protein